MCQPLSGPAARVRAALCLAVLATAGTAQDAVARIKKDLADLEARVVEERGRIEKKKAAVQIEYEGLQKPDVRLAIAKSLETTATKHRDAVRAEAVPAGDSRPDAAAKPSPAFDAIKKESAAAFREAARNLADLVADDVARNLVEAMRAGGDVSTAAVVGESLTEVFGESPPFDAVWASNLAAIYGKELADLEASLAGLKSKLEDAEAAVKNRAAGVPPGMIEVPGGKYEIGDSTDDWQKAKAIQGHTADRKLPTVYYGAPKHVVDLEAFYLDKDEITNRQWAEFCRDVGRAPPPHWVAAEAPNEGAAKTIIDAADAAIGAATAPPSRLVAPVRGMVPAAGTEDVPVTYVSYDAVIEFCAWCGRRLPLETEWEAAARMPAPGEKTRRFFPFGDKVNPSRAPCNYGGALNDPRVRGLPKKKGGNGKDLPLLTPVGSWPEGKSALGFNDLAGNAIELTASPYEKYAGWAPEKVPPGTSIDEQFDSDSVVMRGGQYAANDLMLLASIRRGFPRVESVNSSVGFRTAASKRRGKDLMDALASKKIFEAQLADTGPALRDEAKSGRFPRLDLAEPTAYYALKAGGWNDELKTPARATWLAVAARATKEFVDAVKVKSLAKDQKSPLLLGWIRLDAPMTKPALAPGEYWIMWLQTEEKDPTTKKVVQRSEMIFRTVGRDAFVKVDGVSMVNPKKSTEPTSLQIDKTGSTLSVVLSYGVASAPGSRFICEFKLEAAPGSLKGYQ